MADRSKKKKMITVWIILLAVIAVLFCIVRFILPIFSATLFSRMPSLDDDRPTAPTKSFRLSPLNDAQIAEYAEYDKAVYFEENGIRSAFETKEKAKLAGKDVEFFSDFFEAIKNGDEKAYARFFSEDCLFGDTAKMFRFDFYASGKWDFPEQNIYDILVRLESSDTDNDKKEMKNTYCVSYAIYLNDGTFRTDMGLDEMSPLRITTLEKNGKMQITYMDTYYPHEKASK